MNRRRYIDELRIFVPFVALCQFRRGFRLSLFVFLGKIPSCFFPVFRLSLYKENSGKEVTRMNRLHDFTVFRGLSVFSDIVVSIRR